MNPIEKLERAVRRELPEVKSYLDRPRDAAGRWWLDLELDGHSVAVEWRPHKGFGLSTGQAGYGEGSDEVYPKLEQAVARAIELLSEGKATRPPMGVLRSRLRELRGLTQVQLAERLGIQQSSVSRLEKGDIQLTTLQRYIAALGGELRVQAVFPGEEPVFLDTGTSSAS